MLQCRYLIPAWVAWAYYMTARPIATHFPGHKCMNNLTTERRFDFDSQAMWAIDVLCLFFDVIHWCLYNLALADVRSTVAGIKCLYCNIHYYYRHFFKNMLPTIGAQNDMGNNFYTKTVYLLAYITPSKRFFA